jgi:hypothetical protein
MTVIEERLDYSREFDLGELAPALVGIKAVPDVDSAVLQIRDIDHVLTVDATIKRLKRIVRPFRETTAHVALVKKQFWERLAPMAVP